jgi:NIMA-interacting peptidyl-prolyl cis-trans isomerase 1
MSSHKQLPPGWAMKESSSRPGLFYFINIYTNETQWEIPAEEAKSSPESSQEDEQQEQNEQSSDTIRASHLLVKHKGSRRPSSWRQEHITRSKEEARQIITSYLNEIRNSDNVAQKFAELARQYSDCSSAKKGGDLGVWKRGQMQKVFDDAAFQLKIGELSNEIVDSDSGLHIIYRTG